MFESGDLCRLWPSFEAHISGVSTEAFSVGVAEMA